MSRHRFPAWRWRTRAALLSTLAALSAGCGCEREPVHASPDPAALAELATAPARQDAANARYPSENTESGHIPLENGRYENADGVTATLEEPVARGDLDGDGREDLAVVLSTGTGGSGLFRDLYVLRRAPGQPLRVSAPAALGDRVPVNALRIERDTVVVDLVVQGEKDPLCCPTLPVTYRFRLQGDTLVELSGARRLHLRQ